jgi:hypothetical protein
MQAASALLLDIKTNLSTWVYQNAQPIKRLRQSAL